MGRENDRRRRHTETDRDGDGEKKFPFSNRASVGQRPFFACRRFTITHPVKSKQIVGS